MRTILHGFKRYLPITQNWAYNIIDAVPNCDVHVYAHNFERTNFYPASWHFVDTGIAAVDKLYNTLSNGGIDGAYKIFLKPLLPQLRRRQLDLLRKYIEDKSIDIVHSHFGPFACEMEQIMRVTRIPHVVSFYGFDYEQLPFQRPEYVARYKSLFASASAFVCEGSHGARILEKMGCPSEKLHVVHLGIKVEKIPFVKRKKKPESLRLVQIASVTEKKGYHYTIRAFLEAVKTADNMTLTIVGAPKSVKDHEILDDLLRQIHTHQADDCVSIVPYVDFSKLYDYLSDFDVFIHPSCYAKDMDSEGGAPVVLLDAQATGLPVISTTHCDIPDEVLDGETGLLSPEKSIDGLVKNIKAFYHMGEAEYNFFSANARLNIESNFNIKDSGRRLEEVYSAFVPLN